MDSFSLPHPHCPALPCALGGFDRWRIIAVSAGGRHSVCLVLPLREGAQPVESDEEVDGASEPSLYDK